MKENTSKDNQKKTPLNNNPTPPPKPVPPGYRIVTEDHKSHKSNNNK